MVYLHDRCPNCKSPIVFHRLDIGHKYSTNLNPLSYCSNCLFNLSEVQIPVKKYGIKNYQQYINDTLSNGFNKHTSYSHLFFDFLFIFLRTVKTSSKLWTRVRDGLIRHYNIDHYEFYEKSMFSSLEFRILVLPNIYKLLKNWPHEFIYFCKEYNVRYSDFSKDNEILPFWASRIFYEFF